MTFQPEISSPLWTHMPSGFCEDSRKAFANGPLINTPFSVMSWSSVDGGGGAAGTGTAARVVMPCRLRENNGRWTIVSKRAGARAATPLATDEAAPNHSGRLMADIATDITAATVT